jgi:hypothetical protein
MKRLLLPTFALVMAALLSPLPSQAADPARFQILLPLGRVAYQTNEWIDIAVLRRAPDGLKRGKLVLTLAGQDGSNLAFTFPIKGAAGKPAVATEHLRLNGYLLRPGKYTLRAKGDGATARAKIEVYSHIRESSFKLIDWASRAAKHEQATLGQKSLGFNLLLYAYGGLDPDELIRGGLDYMRNCAMGGWHYMDLRRECDWSDPYVLGGGLARLSRQAFQDRTNPNCLGVHFYDEPLLAEVKDPKDPTGKRLVRYGVPAQLRSFRSMFGHDAPDFGRMNFKDPKDVNRWTRFNRWRLLLLEAAWRLGCYSVRAVRPDYLPISQNQWAWHAFDEGYYFNVNRPFPVISRHAWYDYKHGGDFAPSFAFEFGRVRDLDKPNWYLPMWGCGRSDLFRAEQYLSFMNHLSGMAKPPDLLIHRPSKTACAQGIVESNKLMARLGTIFDNMPVARPPLAVLYSMSHNLHEQTRHRVDSYRGNRHFQDLLYLYMASKILHVPFFPVVDEDVRDGSLDRHHKAVLLAGIDYLDPRVVANLEAYVRRGGAVLVGSDCKVKIKGATPFDFPVGGIKLIADMVRWAETKKWARWNEGVFSNSYFRAAEKVAAALRPKLQALKVQPVLDCDRPGVVASRQALGDIEYLFAVNASPDYDSFGWYFLRTATATIGLPADGRPVYDAIRGGLVGEFRQRGKKLSGTFRFGPGQLRVFARTTRPVGSVQVLTPLQFSDYTRERNPIGFEINAVLVDDRHRVLCGAAPLRVEVTDPLGVKRYRLYRATDRGMLRLKLPLAANDPEGDWKVVVRELLSNREGKATFEYRPPRQCAPLAGAVRRAVIFGRDRANVFRFFQTHKQLTILKGSGKFNDAAARRLAKILEPWDFRCQIRDAAAVKRRQPTAREKPTWVDAGGAFDLRGPVVLLGNPDDNPLIRHLRDQKFLPYQPVKDQFPGRGRGLIAWQRDGLAYFGHESLTLIAYDAAGMAEAVGSAYAIAAGIKPLTPRVLPDRADVQAATKGDGQPPALPEAWRIALPDRPVAMKAVQGGVVVLTADGTLCCLQAGGKVAWQKTLDGGEAWSLDVGRAGRVIVVGAAHCLYAFDDRGKQLYQKKFGQPARKELRSDEGINRVAVSPNGARVLVAFGTYFLDKGGWGFRTVFRLYGPEGEEIWRLGDPDGKTRQRPIKERCLLAVFTADNREIVVMTEKKTRLIDAARGTFGATLGGKNYPAVTRLGADLVFGDGDAKVKLFSSARWKVEDRLEFAKAGPVAFAPTGQGLVIGTEADGTVRLVQGVRGKRKVRTVCQDQVATRLVKQIAAHGHRVAVSYWGSSLRVLNAAGKLRHEQAFSQDITALAWLGNQLVVGLADGRVLALSP